MDFIVQHISVHSTAYINHQLFLKCKKHLTQKYLLSQSILRKQIQLLSFNGINSGSKITLVFQNQVCQLCASWCSLVLRVFLFLLLLSLGVKAPKPQLSEAKLGRRARGMVPVPAGFLACSLSLCQFFSLLLTELHHFLFVSAPSFPAASTLWASLNVFFPSQWENALSWINSGGDVED